MALAGLVGSAASAEPIPGSDIDPVVLEERMDRRLEYAVPETEILAGWMNSSTGEVRNWRCSSLRHMLFDNFKRNPPVRHDPYVNIPDFVRCVEKAVRGFPRPAGPPEHTNAIYQYGGGRQVIMTVNDLTGDVVTIYTQPVNDDWTACANGI